MNNQKIKITVNVLSSKSQINNKNNIQNIPSSSLQKSLPIIRTISINNNNHNSKSIPKDIYHKNNFLKLSIDETPTLDMESSKNSSFITKPLPQTVQITKPRILSVIWAKSKDLSKSKLFYPCEPNSNGNGISNHNTPLDMLVNYNSPENQQREDDMSNFLNYNLGELNNDSESLTLSSVKHINREQVKSQDKCCINPNKIVHCNNKNNFHLITNFTGVRNYKSNQHMYKNSSLKEMEFDLSNISPQLFSFDDFNTSYSRSVYNNDISEMKPNENINDVYKMNTCFTFTGNRNSNLHMQLKSKAADGQKKKFINGFYSDCAKNNGNKNAKSCQKFSFAKDKGDKSKKCLNIMNNKNKNVYNNNNKKGNSNKIKSGNVNNINNKGLNRVVNANNKNVNKRVFDSNVTNNIHNTVFKGFFDKKFPNSVTKKRNNGLCLKETINKKPKTFEKM